MHYRVAIIPYRKDSAKEDGSGTQTFYYLAFPIPHKASCILMRMLVVAVYVHSWWRLTSETTGHNIFSSRYVSFLPLTAYSLSPLLILVSFYIHLFSPILLRSLHIMLYYFLDLPLRVLLLRSLTSFTFPLLLLLLLFLLHHLLFFFSPSSSSSSSFSPSSSSSFFLLLLVYSSVHLTCRCIIVLQVLYYFFVDSMVLCR